MQNSDSSESAGMFELTRSCLSPSRESKQLLPRFQQYVFFFSYFLEEFLVGWWTFFTSSSSSSSLFSFLPISLAGPVLLLPPSGPEAMGGRPSKRRVDKNSLYAAGRDRNYGSGVAYQQTWVSSNSGGMAPPVRESVEKEVPELKEVSEHKQVREPSPNRQKDMPGYANSMDDFYDGIPRYTRARSLKSRSLRSQAAKVSEVGTLLGRAGSLGLGKAVGVLDTLSSTVINLNPTSGFVSGGGAKGNEMSILAFEVANTIVKASNLMQFLSKGSMRHLKEVVLASEGVQKLVSTDMGELLRIVVADKREELKIFVGEVVRFGNNCKDPQWHNLDLYFEKHSKRLTFEKQLKEEVDSMMQQLMTLVQNTAVLYHQLSMLDRYEQDYHQKRIEDAISIGPKGEGLAILRAELKSQRKQVRNLKKKSLWSRSLEEVMEKLVDLAHFLYLEIHNTFGTADSDVNGSVSDRQTLGPAGLALHYANIVMQIDALVAKSSNMPPSIRDALYQNLPPNIKSAMRSKIQSFHVKEELTVTEIKAEMEKTLQWLVPMATNTAKAHHGFGWVGEWAGTGYDVNRKPAVQTEVIQIATFHHANKQKTESFILEQILWLHHLASRSQHGINRGLGSKLKSPTSSSTQKPYQQPNDKATSTPILTEKDEEMLQSMHKKKRTSRISKSQDFDSAKVGLREHNRLSKSSSYSSTRGSKELATVTKLSSGWPHIDFGIDKKKAFDVIDRVDMVR